MALDRVTVNGEMSLRAALATLPPMTPEAAERLQSAMKRGQVEWVMLSLRDNEAEDGDVVAVSTGFAAATVLLRNQAQTVILPLKPGEMIRVDGVVDGGGGITVEVASKVGALNTAPMNPGEHLFLQPR